MSKDLARIAPTLSDVERVLAQHVLGYWEWELADGTRIEAIRFEHGGHVYEVVEISRVKKVWSDADPT